MATPPPKIARYRHPVPDCIVFPPHSAHRTLEISSPASPPATSYASTYAEPAPPAAQLPHTLQFGTARKIY
ncbi:MULTISPECIES: hypothetical protein [unclassified Nocardia]|uniref:hypothetical protein n=1 Tax=unclassified Nocardia TaxID=2637762 RepID=UPI001CE47906|nr:MULTISPECIES: hypothetical protein [unclassified Nocardia]